MNRCDLT